MTAGALNAAAATSPDAGRTVLVVNAASWASTRLANEYVAQRGIPPANIIYLPGVNAFDEMPVEAFRNEILGPVLHEIDARGLRNRVDSIVYSADFPSTIDVSADLKGRSLPPMLAPHASINGLTFFAALVMERDTAYLDLNCNPYARKLAKDADEPNWSAEERQKLAQALRGLHKRSQGDPAPSPEQKQKDLEAVIATLEELRKAHPQSATLLYNLACCKAQRGDPEGAMALLHNAVAAGWSDAHSTARDRDLKSLRDREDFKELVAKLKALPIAVAPSQPFARTYDGREYWLSTMLACTSGRGLAVAEVVAGLRRSAAADGSRPAGTVYYLRNSDIRSTTREWAFAAACERLNALGVRAEVQEGVLPQKQPAVAGAMIGAAGFTWKDSGSSILPGAICEHLTSCGGMMGEYDGQTPLTELLGAGAAGASGTVTEPYAIQGKFPNPFIHWFYAQGCNLAEAFYQSVTGPYQLLIIGDALCRPWAQPAVIELVKPVPGATLKGKLKLSPRLREKPKGPTPAFEVWLDGAWIGTISGRARSLTFDTVAFADGWHELTIAVSPQSPVPLLAVLNVPVWFTNHAGARLEASTAAAELPWDKGLDISLALPGAKELWLSHNGREVGRVSGERGTVTIDPKTLGAGPVRLQPFARVSDGSEPRTVGGAPLLVTIVPPAALAAVELPAGKTLADGLLLTVAGQAPRVLSKLEGKLLGNEAKGTEALPFTIENWFGVDETGVYQFLIHGTASVDALLVDDVPCAWPASAAGGWRFVPVHLAKGLHRVACQGKAGTEAVLDVRFGGPGTRRLAAPRFQHLPPGG